MGQLCGSGVEKDLEKESVASSSVELKQQEVTKCASAEIAGGRFRIIEYKAEYRGCAMECRFERTAQDDTTVGLIQATMCRIKKAGSEDWQLFYTGASGKDLVSARGWWIDAARKRNPVFGLSGTALANSDDDGSNRLGKRGGYASLRDEPSRKMEDGVLKYELGDVVEQRFQTVAMIVAPFGRAGKVLGVLSWGYDIDAEGESRVIRAEESDAVTDEWTGARAEWNMSTITIERVQRGRITIPAPQ